MITDGIHSTKETPPHVLMITGDMATGTARQSLEETVASTVTAVVKAPGAAQSPQPQHNISALPSHCSSTQTPSSLGVSPGKAVDIRGKCFAPLASLKQLFEDSVLTEEEQNSSFLETLRKLS